MDVDLPLVHLDPQVDGRLALVHPVLAARFLLLVPLGERRKLARVVEQGLEAGGAIRGLEARDQRVERWHPQALRWKSSLRPRACLATPSCRNTATVEGWKVPLVAGWPSRAHVPSMHVLSPRARFPGA